MDKFEDVYIKTSGGAEGIVQGQFSMLWKGTNTLTTTALGFTSGHKSGIVSINHLDGTGAVSYVGIRNQPQLPLLETSPPELKSFFAPTLMVSIGSTVLELLSSTLEMKINGKPVTPEEQNFLLRGCSSRCENYCCDYHPWDDDISSISDALHHNGFSFSSDLNQTSGALQIFLEFAESKLSTQYCHPWWKFKYLSNIVAVCPVDVSVAVGCVGKLAAEFELCLGLGGPVDAACADAIVNDNYCGRVVPTLN